MPWTRRTDRWTGNIFVLLTEENIWSICQFGSCQVWRKVHSVTLSAWLASRTWARLTNTTSKSPCLLFYSCITFFMSFFICMCRNIFPGKRKMCWLPYLRVCGWWQHWACCEASGGDNQNVTNKNSGQLSTIVRTVKLGLVSVLMSPLSTWRGSK